MADFVGSSTGSKRDGYLNASNNLYNVSNNSDRNPKANVQEEKYSSNTHDWKERLDPKTNRKYYYSPSRRTSTWNIEKFEQKENLGSTPSNSNAAIQTHHASSNNSLQNSVLTGPSKKSSTSPSNNTKSHYSIADSNTGTYSKKSSSPTNLFRSSRSGTTLSPDGNNRTPPRNPTLTIELPFKTSLQNANRHEGDSIFVNGEEWVKKLDKNTHRFYWYSKVTRKSSWYPPGL
jgi:hypothetical protein